MAGFDFSNIEALLDDFDTVETDSGSIKETEIAPSLPSPSQTSVAEQNSVKETQTNDQKETEGPKVDDVQGISIRRKEKFKVKYTIPEVPFTSCDLDFKRKPSRFGFFFCNNFKDSLLPRSSEVSILSSVNGIPQFKFDIKSPDDAYLARKKKWQ